MIDEKKHLEEIKLLREYLVTRGLTKFESCVLLDDMLFTIRRDAMFEAIVKGLKK